MSDERREEPPDSEEAAFWGWCDSAAGCRLRMAGCTAEQLREAFLAGLWAGKRLRNEELRVTVLSLLGLEALADLSVHAPGEPPD